MSRLVDISPYEKCRIVLRKDDSGFPVSELPTVDAVEVVHGHKIIRNRPYAAQYIYVGDDGYGNLVKRTDCSGTPIEISPATLSNPIEYCSECGKRMDGIWQNFCDNCGAKMDEVSE